MMENQPKKRLSDIKKQLGLQKEEVYGVFKYNSKTLAGSVATSTSSSLLKPHKQARRCRSLVVVTAEKKHTSPSTEVSLPMATKPSSKQRRPPPPKPPPYKPIRENSPINQLSPSSSDNNGSNNGAAPGSTMTIKIGTDPRPLSPNTLSKIEARPRLDTPVFKKTETENICNHPNMDTPPISHSLKTPSPDTETVDIDSRPKMVTPPIPCIIKTPSPDMKTDDIDSPLKIDTPPFVKTPPPSSPVQFTGSPLGDDKYAMTYDVATVVAQNEQPGQAYSEVSIKGLATPPTLADPPMPTVTDISTEYDVTSHLQKSPPHIVPFQEYSVLNQSGVSSPRHHLPQYDEINVDAHNDPGLPVKPVQKSSVTPLRDSKDAKSSPSARRKPPTPGKPAIAPKPPHLDRNSSGSDRSSPVPPVAAKECSTDSPSKRPPSPSHRCVVDIDAIISRTKTEDFKVQSDHSTPQSPHLNGDTGHERSSSSPQVIPVSERSHVLPVRHRHVYDDIDLSSTNSQLSSPSLDEHDKEQGKRVKIPPRRKPPPPPIPKWSPPVERRTEPAPESKSLTLGRSPRNISKIYHEEQISPNVQKKMSASASPGLKTKLKTLFRGSRDDTFTGQGSFRKKKNKNPMTITSPTETMETTNSTSLTLPNRPRGKSLDPYMSNDVTGIYSLMGDTEEGGGQEVIPQAFPYCVIDTETIIQRQKKGKKGLGLRASRSVEHLCDSAERSYRSPSPIVKSPSIPDLSDELHIYATINKPKSNKVVEEQVVDQENEETKEEKEPEGEEVVDEEEKGEHEEVPPPIPVYHVTAEGGQVYAVVSKVVNMLGDEPPDNPVISEKQLHNQIDTSSPPRTTQTSSPQPKRRAPPKPKPYIPSNNVSSSPVVAATPTKASSKFSHLLTSSPPSHSPPSPPEDTPTTTSQLQKPSVQKTHSFDIATLQKNRIHDYEQVDFDNPMSSIPSSHVTSTVVAPIQPGKLRELKPKERPAPPPPFVKKLKPIGDNKASSSPDHIGSPASSTPTESPSKRGGKSRCLDLPSPQFLFPDGRTVSFIEAGDSQAPLSPSASSSTLSSVMEVNDDSDVSTDWDQSSAEEEEEEKVPKSKIFYIAQEILTTERTFVKGLGLLHNDFRKHMLSANNAHEKQVISDEILTQILSNVGSLYMLNSELLKELETRMSTWDSEPRIGDIFVRRAPYLKMYSQYISNFDNALKKLEEQQKKNPLFSQVLKEFELEPKCSNLTVASYLLETVQRIPRYKLLLADYIKHLPEDSIDKTDSEKALSIISSVATHVNETIRQMDNFRKTVEVSKKLIGDVGDSLISPHRKLLKEGELIKSSRKEKQPRMFFLFTDLLIYASAIPPANTTFRVIKRIPLDGMKVELLDDPELKHGFQIISTCKSFRLDTSTMEERHQWIQAFDTAIKDHVQRIKSRQINRRNTISDMTDGDIEGSETANLGSLAPPWLPDSSVSMCQLCSIRFTVTRRRHHCRACGQIFCGECSGYMTPLKYNNNKLSRVCQTCYSTLNEGVDETIHQRPSKKKPLRTSQKKISMPSVLTEVRARDQSAQVSGYLLYREEKSRQWKKNWFVIYDLVMYEFKRHEDVSAQKSIPLPSYQVTNPVVGLSDPFVFSLQHPGTKKVLLFKTEDESQLESWLEVLYKAVRGEVDL